MVLKTDYKDDGFTGNRKYRMITNADGTMSFEDVTPYDPVGDSFGAMDVNTINKTINRLDHVTEVTLTAADWSSSAPYTQTVNISGMVETDRPTVSLYLPDGITAADVDLRSIAYDCINRAVSGNGSITVYCYKKKPAVDFQIQVKGV